MSLGAHFSPASSTVPFSEPDIAHLLPIHQPWLDVKVGSWSTDMTLRIPQVGASREQRPRLRFLSYKRDNCRKKPGRTRDSTLSCPA
jgi:hypothetical protein